MEDINEQYRRIFVLGGRQNNEPRALRARAIGRRYLDNIARSMGTTLADVERLPRSSAQFFNIITTPATRATYMGLRAARGGGR